MWLFTERCHLKGHLYVLGLTNSPTCVRCLKKIETVLQILCDHDGVIYLRCHHLGQYFVQPGYYLDDALSEVLHFV